MGKLQSFEDGVGQKREGGQDPLSQKRAKKRKFKLVDNTWGNNEDVGQLKLNSLNNLTPLQKEEGHIVNPGGGEEIKKILVGGILESPPDPPDKVEKAEDENGVKNHDVDVENVNVNDVGNVELAVESVKNVVECTAVRRKCSLHRVPAKMIKSKKSIRIKSGRTGLFWYKTRTSVQWQCPIQPDLMALSSLQSASETESLQGIVHNSSEAGCVREIMS